MEKERAPFVAVYTDDGDFNLASEGVGTASLYDDGGTVYLVVEVSVAGQALDAPEREPEAPEGDDDAMEEAMDPSIFRPVKDRETLASTDAGLEARIGFMARQVIDALAAPDNPWGELWRVLVHDRGQVEVRRGGSGLDPKANGAVRYASRVMRFTLGVLAEPVPGGALGPGTFWERFLTAAEADEELAGVAAIVRDHIEGTAQEPWLIAQRAMTLTDQGVRGIGIGPAIRESRETPPLTGVDRIWMPGDE